VGHLDGVDGERILLAPGLASNLRFADTFFDERMRTEIDTVIEQAGIDAPPDDRETVDYEPPEVLELDLAVEGVSTVLWTSGYRLDFSWIDLPIFDEFGAPRHVRGVTEVPGLTFLGLPWQLNQGSATFLGVANDARYLAERW
jgi:putative flavoprotein involved in K+ transport